MPYSLTSIIKKRYKKMGVGLINYFISVVIVIKNKNNLEEFVKKISDKLSDIPDHEIVIIDNSGDPDTVDILSEITSENGLPNIQVLKLAEQIEDYKASWLGFENSIGDFVMRLEFELIKDNKIIESILNQVSKGNEIVLLQQKSIRKKNDKFKYVLYKILGNFSNIILGVNLNTFSCKTLIISRRIVNYLTKFKNPELKLRTISSIKGLKKSILNYEYQSQDKENLLQSLSRGLKIITSSTSLPLRFATTITSLGAIFSFLYSIYVLLIFIFKDNVAPGWASISLQLSFMFFCLSLLLLVMSEYLLEALSTIYNKPKYFISDEFTSSIMTSKEKLNVNEIKAYKRNYF